MDNKDLDKYFGKMEDHQYRHYNRALGCFVEGKEHFKYLMRSGNYLPYDKAEEILSSTKRPRKEYKISKEAEEFLRGIKMTADSKGRVKLGSRAIDRMKELGVDFTRMEEVMDLARNE